MVEILAPVLGPDLAPPVAGIIKALVLVAFVALSAIFFIWLERKVAGRIQDRLGPTRVGGKFGWLQTIADGIKLLVKEDIIPATADQFLFRAGPYIAFCASFLGFLALPFGNGVVAQNLNIAVFFVLAVLSVEVFGVILAGYGSGSKWSLFGGMREAAQVVSYEVPMAICVLVPVLVVGTMNLNRIGQMQAGWFFSWNVFRDPFLFAAFWTYFTCATASCKRAPFDLAEAESELVAGFHTEYSGLRWSFFFMAEYASMFAVSGIATLLFLGGWHTGLVPTDLTQLFGSIAGNVLNVAVFIVKCWLLVFVMMWVRWTLPRLRIDQVMQTCLKYLLPISCVLLLGASLWQLLMPVFVLNYLRYVIGGAVACGWLALLIRLVTGKPPAGEALSLGPALGRPGYELAKR
ncbi:MAG: NADH-quinone oxidoreductase subunit NuoH [Gemmataceae bacterium]|nr:NADH-quinone oxidoreductase subunit NuoH [Gemmataceae bacterium]MDW8264050.1 NADH-quinone oxidoreductase subunit NuoH [Gemmataceae bacterium]